MNDYLYETLFVGQKEDFDVIVTKEMVDAFRHITGDINPLHYDDDFAVSISSGKYREHIVFGMLTASLYSKLVGVYLPGKYSVIHSVENISFITPVYEGDKLHLVGEIESKQDGLRLVIINSTIYNQDNKKVSKAKIKVLVNDSR